VLLALVMGAVAWSGGEAAAREVRLGGQEKSTSPDKTDLPPNVVGLPTITLAIRREDGGWRHVTIDAWLVPKDVDTARSMDQMKSLIVRNLDKSLPKRSFELLQSANDGSNEAKKAIHEAAEISLGHPWTGDVLIRSLLVY
jgi:hypothetical protein